MLASFTVFRFISADVPPITIARWYGGQADVPSVRIFVVDELSSDVGFSSALVSWNRNVLLALPPPFVMTRKLYASPSTAERSIWAGRFVPVLTLLVRRDRSELASSAGWSPCRCGTRPGPGPPRRRRARQPSDAPGPDLLALLAHDDRRAGVLAARQDHAGRHAGVLQHRPGDEAVVLGGLGVVEHLPELREVARAEQVRDVADRLGGEQRQRPAVDLEDPLNPCTPRR